MASTTEVPIFTDTNLGTRIALSVPPDIAARDFKRKLETVHLKCFPESGEIKIYGLMVKRKSRYYHLADSVPMKRAFEGVRGTWFLRVEARASHECFEPYIFNFNPGTEDIDRVSDASGITEPLEPTESVTSDTKGAMGKECREKELQSRKPSLEERTRLVYVSRKSKRKKRERKNCILGHNASSEEVALLASSSYDHKGVSRSVTEVPSEMFSEAKSVTSIIRRYFPNSNEKASFSSPTSSEATSRHKKAKRGRSYSSVNIKSCPKFADRSPSSFLLFTSPATNPAEKTFKGSVNTAEVGERLVMAMNNLRLLSSKKKPAIHLRRKARHHEAASLIRLSVFDISGSDD